MVDRAWMVVVSFLAVGCVEAADGSKACGAVTAEGESAGDGAPESFCDFPDAYARALCENLGACCARAGYALNEADCHRRYSDSVSDLMEQVDEAPTEVTYHPVAAAACLEKWVEELRQCAGGSTNFRADSCDAMLTGTIGPGARCTRHVECAPVEGAHVVCSPEEEKEPPRCWPGTTISSLSHGAQGDSCSATCLEIDSYTGDCVARPAPTQGAPSPGDTICYLEENLYCASSLTCAPLPEAGAACDWTCAPGAYCSNGTCLAKVATGPCDLNRDTNCAETSYCDPANDQCVPLSADGEACDRAEQCLNGGCYGGICGTELVVENWLCAADFS